MAKYIKGQEKVPGSGRKPGVQNKTTKKYSQFIQGFLDEYRDSGKMKEDWDHLEERDRLEIAVKMFPYIMPKKTDVSASVNMSSDETIEETLLGLAGEQ